MSDALKLTALLTIAFVLAGNLAAQSVLAQLGLTEAAARDFLFDEVKSQRQDHPFARRDAIAIAGTRGFYRLPPGARGPAATALFAWAKAYANSPAFRAAYADFRRNAIPPEQVYTDTLDEAVKKQIDEMLVAVEQSKQMAAKVDPKTSAAILDSVKKQEAQIRSPEFAVMLRTGLELERAGKVESAGNSNRESIAKYPVNPEEIFARRLREFLDVTADANFSARTIHLTGGPDGIEFVDPADRKRSTIWQLAVIAGPEATAAARAAAQAWLKEIER
jgi:hypothetical protein